MLKTYNIITELELWRDAGKEHGIDSEQAKAIGAKVMPLLIGRVELLPDTAPSYNRKFLLNDFKDHFSVEHWSKMNDGGYCWFYASDDFITDLKKTQNNTENVIPYQPALSKENAIKNKDCWHNEDFVNVVWFGTNYQFNKTQGLVVKYLWENQAAAEESIGNYIGSAAGKDYRLKDTFRNKKGYHCAWGKMIKDTGKGLFKLIYPES